MTIAADLEAAQDACEVVLTDILVYLDTEADATNIPLNERALLWKVRNNVNSALTFLNVEDITALTGQSL